MAKLLKSLRLPVIAAPMFLVSGPSLVIASCKAGIIGTFPALNPRTEPLLNEWLTQIRSELDPTTPFGVNLIVHKTNKRLDGNLEQIVKHKVPLVITSLGAAKDVVDAVHEYGGVVFHDVTNITHARKAIKAYVDGLIAVTAGAGGHAGLASPFALVPQLRSEFDGVICLGGAISTGGGIRAAQALGADFAYMGTRFIATQESMAQEEFKDMIISSKSGTSPTFLPIIYTDKISGVHANFLRSSLEQNGFDLKNIKGDGLGEEDFSQLHSDGKTNSGSAWKDIWSAGHGVLNIHDKPTVKTLVDRLEQEYQVA
ncbi:putative dioxygenase protein [Globomyces pollinis-pini]|nr:putative dioxygenase protein [Globomyces pollinis-pini]